MGIIATDKIEKAITAPFTKDNEREFTVVDVFSHKRRICVVIKLVWLHKDKYPRIREGPTFDDSHNGYVSVLAKHKFKDFEKLQKKIKSEELTYGDFLTIFKDKRIPDAKWFVGFDNLHYWNDRHPESKTFDNVRERTVKLAEEMVRKKI